MKRLVSKIDFANMVNVSPAAITKACNNKLKPAFDGKRIDLNNYLVIEYMKKKQEQQDRKNQQLSNDEKLKKVNNQIKNQETEHEEYEFVKVKPINKTKNINSTNNKEQDKTKFYTNQGKEIPEEIRQYLHYTVEDIINDFGTVTSLNDFLLASKRIEDIHTSRIKNDKSKGLLVERELIEKGILNPMNSAHTRLLTDGSKTLVKRILAKKETGITIQELEEYTSEQISNFLKSLKQSIKRTLEQLDKNVKQ